MIVATSSVADSTTSKREKSVALTPRGIDYLAHQRLAARAIEDELRAELGGSALRCWRRCSTVGRWRGCAPARRTLRRSSEI